MSGLQWDQLIRLLDRQAEILSQLRDRTGIVLSASGIVSAVFGAAAFNHHPANVAFWLGLIVAVTGLTAGLWFSILVLLPVKDTDTKPSEPIGRSAKIARRLRGVLEDADTQRVWGVTLPTDVNRDLSMLLGQHDGEAGQHDGEAAVRAKAYDVLRRRPAQNLRTIAARNDFFIAACASLFVQLVGWIIALIAHG